MFLKFSGIDILQPPPPPPRQSYDDHHAKPATVPVQHARRGDEVLSHTAGLGLRLVFGSDDKEPTVEGGGRVPRVRRWESFWLLQGLTRLTSSLAAQSDCFRPWLTFFPSSCLLTSLPSSLRPSLPLFFLLALYDLQHRRQQ